MKKTSLLFLTFETLISFVNGTKPINLSISPKQRIVRGLFSEDDVLTATTKFGASIIDAV
ncbi:MAG TPA: hypothetical protein VFL70_03475 [Bacteroidia bacterium]|nr:hypothetical protein [Bacteroidia bacterium]